MSWFVLGIAAMSVYLVWAGYRMLACRRWRKNIKVGDVAHFRSLAGMTEVTVTNILDDGRVIGKTHGDMLTSTQAFWPRELYGGWRI